MNKTTEQAILGSMCGDGTIRHRYTFPVYREAHSIKQEDYLIWKSKLLKELKPKIIYGEGMSQRRDKIFKNVELYTPMNKNLLKYHKLFYDGNTGEKRITYDVLKMLKPLGLAIWYMDDGSYFYRGSVVELASCMNNLNVQKDIKRYFKDILDLDCSINKASKGLHIIKFSVESSDRFLRIIEKYIPKSMRYKLGHLCEDNLSKLKEAKEKVSIYCKEWRMLKFERISIQKKKYNLKRRLQMRKEINESEVPGNTTKK